jgi:hypothetical protein
LTISHQDYDLDDGSVNSRIGSPRVRRRFDPRHPVPPPTLVLSRDGNDIMPYLINDVSDCRVQTDGHADLSLTLEQAIQHVVHSHSRPTHPQTPLSARYPNDDSLSRGSHDERGYKAGWATLDALMRQTEAATLRATTKAKERALEELGISTEGLEPGEG